MIMLNFKSSGANTASRLASHRHERRLHLKAKTSVYSRGNTTTQCKATSYPEARLAESNGGQELEEECKVLEEHIATWLDEEWTPMAEHSSLAQKCVQTYKQSRETGETDLGDILLHVSGVLSSEFDFGPTFTDAFEVSNKLVELLMVRQGDEVCCRSDQDKASYKRIETQGS